MLWHGYKLYCTFAVIIIYLLINQLTIKRVEENGRYSGSTR